MHNAGKYRHWIRFQTLDENDAWIDLLRCRAAVNGLGGAEYWKAAAVDAQETVVFEVRYTPKIGGLIPQTCRIIFPAVDGDIYDVKHIDDYLFRHETLKVKGVRSVGRYQIER